MDIITNKTNVDTQTYRYTTENKNRPWGVSNSYSKENYFGDKRISYNTCLIPIGSFNYDGIAKQIEMKAYVYKPSNQFPKFCWAVCTSDSYKHLYENVHGAVNDPAQIATGTAELNSLYWAWQTFIFNIKSVPTNTPLYVYFWPYSTGGVAHIDGEITATLYYEPRQPIKASKQVKYNENIEIKRSI